MQVTGYCDPVPVTIGIGRSNLITLDSKLLASEETESTTQKLASPI